MKKVLILLLVFILSSTIAFAEVINTDTTVRPNRYIPEEYVYVEYPIWPLSLTKWGNEAVLVAGKSTLESEKHSTATMMMLDTSGQQLWEYEESDLPEWTEYTSVQQLDVQTIVALLNTSENTYIEWIDQNGLVKRSADHKKFYDFIRAAYANEQGLLLVGNPENDFSTIFVQIDRKGEVLWFLGFDEYFIFHGSVQNKEVTYLFGTESIGAPGNYTYQGTILAIDTKGQLLWKHSNFDFERFTNGCIIVDDQILLAGSFADRKLGVGISCVDSNGFIWQKDLPDHTVAVGDVEMKTYLVDSVISYKDDYLVACNGLSKTGAGSWIYRIDDEGNILSVDYLFCDRIYSIEGSRLFELNGKTYLLSYGMVDAADVTDVWNSDKDMGDYIRGFYLAELNI